MMDDIIIGSAPSEEDCVQVNPQGDYHEAMRAECRRFLGLILKKMGPEPPGAKLVIKENPHEFGSYDEVVCVFDNQDEEAIQYALRCEDEAPTTWNDDKPVPVPAGSVEGGD